MNFTDRLAVSSVTFRDEPLDRALQRLQDAGFARLDLTAIRHYCDHFDPLLVSVGEDECYRVRDLIADHSLQTVSVTTYPDNPLARDLNADDWVNGVDAYVRLGMILGARALIFPPGSPAPQPERWRGTIEHAVPWQREAAWRTVNARMLPVIALQSNSLLRTSEQGLGFLSVLGVPEAGLAIDPAHLAAMGEDPVEAIKHMGAAIAYVILRDTDGSNFNLPPGAGTLDYHAILDALDIADYDGLLVLAIDDISLPAEQRVDLLKRGWDFLHELRGRKAA